MSKFDEVFARVKIVASKIASSTSTVLVNITGYQTGDTPSDTEVDKDLALLGVLGLVVRPRPKDDAGQAIGLAARTNDSFIPFASIDRRITKARGAIAESAISLAGYFGQHVTLEDAAGDGTTGGKITIALAGGAIQIVLDSTVAEPGTVIKGLVRCVGAGDESAARPVVLEPAATKIGELVAAVNTMAGILNTAGPVTGAPGAVTPVPVPGVLVSSCLKASP
jgi:hypothetical protein